MEDIEGRWRVVSVDGISLPELAGSGQAPYLSIGPRSVGGSLGCNSFGALALYTDGRFAIHSWSGTAMYCEGIAEQERAISELFFAQPAVEQKGSQVVVRSAEHQVVLSDRQADTLETAVPASQALIGTRWRISFIDQSEKSTSPEDRYLTFTDVSWQGLASCATLFGAYLTNQGRLIVEDEIASTEQLCPEEYAALDDAFADLMRSNPRYLVGPNGELIIAGHGHVLTGGAAQ
ncbi:META domain-containing protein [Aurantiacibacter atlanticus]|uniref:META domain-containing protein n=1 Tax=Aurantiacibacter atlanticus TaxID=1648404 RepID=UPI001D0FF664|nr:META domain-containing protein [Aurantiacibacter atlanticus]